MEDKGVQKHLSAALTSSSKENVFCDPNARLGAKRRLISQESDRIDAAETTNKRSKRGRSDENENQKKTNLTVDKPAIKKLKVRRFASQAHALMCELSQSAPHAASWSNSGEMLIIKHKTKFAEELHNYFNTSKFESFTKQLNVYGFMKGSPGWEIVNGIPKPMMIRTSSGLDGENKPARTSGVRFNEEHICFWHPCFQRDQKDLLVHVQPIGRKKPGAAMQVPPTVPPRSGKESEPCVNVGGEEKLESEPRGETLPPSTVHQSPDSIDELSNNDVGGNKLQLESETEPISTMNAAYWRGQVHSLEQLIEQRSDDFDKSIDDLQMRQCLSIQEIAQEIQDQCSLQIEGDRGMVRGDAVVASEEAPPRDASSLQPPSRLNPWCIRPKLTGMQARLHASYANVFDIAEPLVFEEYGLHDMLSANFQFKGNKSPEDYLK